MTELSPDLTTRLAKLLPRLASNHDGEVVATAAAIARTLEASGRDLHDLAEHVAAPSRTVIVYRDRPNDAASAPPADPAETITWCLDAGAERMSEWEITFVRSLGQQIVRGKPPSPKQIAVLDDIAAQLRRRP